MCYLSIFGPKLNSNQLSLNGENKGTYENWDREIFSLPINNSFNLQRLQPTLY